MSRKFDVNAGMVGNPKLTLVRFTLVAVTSVVGATLTNIGTAHAESSLPVSGDDPLAWLERPVDCGLTNDAVNARYGAILKGGTKNSLLSEEFKFVSSETCSGKRFSSCQFSWCKPLGEQAAEKPVAESITGKVEQFAKVQAEEKSRGWEFEGDDEEELAAGEPSGNLVAGNLVAASEAGARGALANSMNEPQFRSAADDADEVRNTFVPPKLVLGKDSIPTLPNGEIVKGVKRVNGSFLPVSYEVPSSSERSPRENTEPAVKPASLKVEPAVAAAPEIIPPQVAVEKPQLETPTVENAKVENARAETAIVEPAKAAIPTEPAPAPRVVSLVNSSEIVLRTEAERELIELEKKLRDKQAGRIQVREADEKLKKIAWKVIEVPGASVRASFGRGGPAESVAIKGANTSEYSRSIVPGIGKAPANTVTAEDQFLSKYNVTVLPVERFKHATPPLPGTPTLESSTAKIDAAKARIDKLSTGPKMDYGVPVPLEEGDLKEIGKLMKQ